MSPAAGSRPSQPSAFSGVVWRLVRGALTATVVLAGWQAGPAQAAENSLLLFDPAAPLDAAWEHRRFEGETDYTRTSVDGAPAVRAVGQQSASGLYRKVSWRLADHPWLSWRWRVDRLQASADIRTKAAQDFGAAIFLIFEEPMLLMRHRSVLSYVWTNDRLAAGSIVPSPYNPDSSRALVVQSGTARLGQWVGERRSVVEDYRRTFGEAPPEEVSVIALFTDNDQTDEPVEAYYGAIRAEAE